MEEAKALALKYVGGLLLAAGLGLLVYAVIVFRRASDKMENGDSGVHPGTPVIR